MDKNKKLSASELAEIKSIISERVQVKSDLDRTTEKAKYVLAQIDKDISNFMFVHGINTITVDADQGTLFRMNPKTVMVTKVEQTKIEWDTKQLEENLEKDVAEKVIQKKYIVKDMPALIDLLKSYGVKSKEFKKLIDVERKVNTDKVNELSEVGEITRKDLTGTYKTISGSKYLRFTVKEKNSGAGDRD